MHAGCATTGRAAPRCCLQWRELFAVPEDLAYAPAMVAPLPQRAHALLVVVRGLGAGWGPGRCLSPEGSACSVHGGSVRGW